MLNEFLKQSGLTFREYSEWFSSLKKGDEVSCYGFLSNKIVDEVLPTGLKLNGVFGIYRVEKYTVYYQTPLNNSFLAENFPIPLKEQIEQIKQKRLSILWLKVGETYEDSEGSEWLVENDDLPFGMVGSFTCACLNLDKGIRYYTSEGKFAGKPHPFDLIKKKERQMPIEESSKALEQSPTLSIGQIWENENQKEMTVVSWDEDLCKFFLVAEDGSGVWVVPSGYESWSNKKHAVKYLGETKRPRLEVGKSYYKSDEELVILVKYDNSDDTYQGDDDTWYYQFGFPYDCGGESTIVRTAENQAVENEATETKPLCLVIGDMYQTKEGEIFEVKSKEPCGRFKCLSRLGEALLYSKEGKLTPDPYNGAMDFVSQFMPEVTNSSKKKIEYFASEIEKNLKDLLDELKTEKSRAELFDENTKLFNQIRLLIKENLDLKQKLTSIKAFLEPDHK